MVVAAVISVITLVLFAIYYPEDALNYSQSWVNGHLVLRWKHILNKWKTAHNREWQRKVGRIQEDNKKAFVQRQAEDDETYCQLQKHLFALRNILELAFVVHVCFVRIHRCVTLTVLLGVCDKLLKM